ncbi:MAG: hypothetical protein DCF28_11880 [Alphaproteobacteria bacterium]|nr:MAG: hypothetical protein DCF28_11880 [Alphaproteobacteria bacterium]PZO40915.1 MAG: hypothetical protein DCE92_01760 [Alphaproteobacteria bacterium]
MEDLILSTHRTSRTRSVSENFQTAAWRAPTSPRFDSRAANDLAHRAEATETGDRNDAAGTRVIPNWFIAIAGGLIVAMLAVFAAHATAI